MTPACVGRCRQGRAPCVHPERCGLLNTREPDDLGDFQLLSREFAAALIAAILAAAYLLDRCGFFN